MIEYITVSEAAEKWNITVRQVQSYCYNGKINGVIKFGKMWAIPKDSSKPIDNRIVTGKYVKNNGGIING